MVFLLLLFPVAVYDYSFISFVVYSEDNYTSFFELMLAVVVFKTNNAIIRIIIYEGNTIVKYNKIAAFFLLLVFFLPSPCILIN